MTKSNPHLNTEKKPSDSSPHFDQSSLRKPTPKAPIAPANNEINGLNFDAPVEKQTRQDTLMLQWRNKLRQDVFMLSGGTNSDKTSSCSRKGTKLWSVFL